MTEYGFLSVLPPVLALALAIFTRQVYVSLFAGIWLGHAILLGFTPVAALVGTVDAMVAVFEDPGRTKIILLSAMIGAFLTFTQYSGGMRGLVDWLTQRGLVTTRRSAGILAWCSHHTPSTPDLCALHVAAREGRASTVIRFLAFGAHVDIRDALGWSA